MSVTGMRTQEALGLQWGDIDFENATIHIQRAVTEEIVWDSHGNKVTAKTVLGPTKNGSSERKITVPEEVIRLLKQWREIAPFISKTQLGTNDCVFGNSKGPSWTYAGFRSSVNRTLKNSDSGVDSLRLHRLRHFTNFTSFDYGHYFSTRQEAMIDYFQRLAEAWEHYTPARRAPPKRRENDPPVR